MVGVASALLCACGRAVLLVARLLCARGGCAISSTLQGGVDGRRVWIAWFCLGGLRDGGNGRVGRGAGWDGRWGGRRVGCWIRLSGRGRHRGRRRSTCRRGTGRCSAGWRRRLASCRGRLDGRLALLLLLEDRIVTEALALRLLAVVAFRVRLVALRQTRHVRETTVHRDCTSFGGMLAAGRKPTGLARGHDCLRQEGKQPGAHGVLREGKGKKKKKGQKKKKRKEKKKKMKSNRHRAGAPPPPPSSRPAASTAPKRAKAPKRTHRAPTRRRCRCP